MHEITTENIVDRLNGLSEIEREDILHLVEEKVSAAETRKSKTFIERMLEISSHIPDEEWAKLPSDGSVNHDHYLYGALKRY